MTEQAIVGRCAVPGCPQAAVVRVNESVGSDILCAVHAEDELRLAARFGTEGIQREAQRLLDEAQR